MTLQITDAWMRDQKACKEGYRAFLKNFPNVTEFSVLNILRECQLQGNFEFANWLLLRTLDRGQWHEYCFFAADLAFEFKNECLETEHASDILAFGIKIFERQV